MKCSLLINPLLTSLRGLNFRSLYCPLSFDYGVYSEMTISLRMIKQCI